MNAANQMAHLSHYEELGISVPQFDDRTLGEHIAANAKELGDAPALLFGDFTMNYREYEEQANKLANALSDLGLVKGDVVGIHLPNIPQYPIAVAAISKLGCIGSGVSPLLTPSEIAFQVKDANIKVMLTLSDFTGLFSKLPSPPECLTKLVICSVADLSPAVPMETPVLEGFESISYAALTREQSSQHTQVPCHWDDTFMLQYTGGTTGKPKGTQLTVRNLMHNSAQFGSALSLLRGQEVFASAFPFFHVGGFTMLPYTARTAALMILIPNARDTEFFCQQMIKATPTVIGAVPALYDMLLKTPQFADIDFSKLKVAFTGAAPMPTALHKELVAAIGENKLSDLFGMTETSPSFVMHPSLRYKSGSVGFPVPSAKVRIADMTDYAKEMPIGEPGEILAAGPQNMKGYLNLPEETANTLREIDGDSWVCTGDVGYVDEEGYLFLCDRAKDMLIVGGFKVFSVEVEDKLNSMPEIAMSAVIGKPDPKREGNEIVTLYAQLNPEFLNQEKSAIKEVIKSYCVDNLSPYKVPKEIHIIDAIPLTAVGKIDKKVLRN